MRDEAETSEYSGTDSKGSQQESEIRGVDGPIPVEILRTITAGSPRAEEQAKIAGIDDPITIDICNAWQAIHRDHYFCRIVGLEEHPIRARGDFRDGTTLSAGVVVAGDGF